MANKKCHYLLLITEALNCTTQLSERGGGHLSDGVVLNNINKKKNSVRGSLPCSFNMFQLCFLAILPLKS